MIAESYERIHRSNLVGMGVLPLQFKDGEGVKTLGLTGRETFRISGIADGVDVHELLAVTAEREDGSTVAFEAIARLDSAVGRGVLPERGDPAHGAAAHGARGDVVRLS